MRGAAVLVATLLLSAALMAATPRATAQDEPAIVVVGDQDQMRSRNVLRVSLGPATGEDVGVGILQTVYSTPLLSGPAVGELRPYIAKGVDADGDGVFEASEYGAFRKDPGTNATDVVAYLDFNGVRWHDGAPMTLMDLSFSLVIGSLSPRYSADLRVLWDRAGAAGSNFTWTRWLAVSVVPKSWEREGSMPGDPSLRVAVQFRLQEPYAVFFDRVLGGLWLLPRHVWEGTGGGRHADFGRSIYPEGDPRAGQGIPVNETVYKPFDYGAAEAWEPSDADVVGAGPFRFTTLTFGVYTRLDRNDAYYVGTEPSTPAIVYDPRLAAAIHRPFVGGFLFKIYRTTQLGVLALEYGEIDYYRANLPPEFVPDLGMSPIRFWVYPEAGFTALGYNMRRPWLGYDGTPPGAVDTGRAFRIATAHLFDKRTLVDTLLQHFGIIADSVVSPANTQYYNESVPKPAYDLVAARAILDNAGFVDTDGDGWRELPVRGDAGLDILTTQADYEPVRPAVGTMWAGSMRAVGLNVTLQSTPFGTLINRVEARDFDMFILGWRVSESDPDYLFRLFHCSESDSGLNYAGHCNPSLDRTLEASRGAMTPSERVRLIRWAQGIIMEDRPVEPLYYRTSIQATRQDTFVNWTQTFAGVWNYWSWIGVFPVTQLQDLWLSISVPTAMSGGGRAPIVVQVRARSGIALADATVSLRVLAADGGKFVESDGAYIAGRTDATGRLVATYEAPVTLEGMRDALIQVTANHDLARAPVERTVVIMVFGTGLSFLSLRVSFPAGDLTTPDGPIPIRIEALDPAGGSVSDALVRANVWPSNGSMSRTNGTAAEMGIVTFAPPRDLLADQEYGVEVSAAKVGYAPARVNVSVLVVVLGGGGTPPSQGGELDGLLFGVGIVAFLLAGAAFAVFAWGWRSRGGRGRARRWKAFKRFPP